MKNWEDAIQELGEMNREEILALFRRLGVSGKTQEPCYCLVANYLNDFCETPDDLEGRIGVFADLPFDAWGSPITEYDSEGFDVNTVEFHDHLSEERYLRGTVDNHDLYQIIYEFDLGELVEFEE